MIEIFDNTMLSLYKACPQKFFFRMVLNLTPKREEGVAKQWGGALHNALDIHYSGGGKESVVKKFVEEFTPFEGKDEKRTLMRGITILTQYFEKYEKEPFEVKHTEIGFSAELERYIICGKMDGIVDWRMGFGGLVVMEHKFSGSKGYLVVEPNQQLDTYIWGAIQLTNENVIGALFNLIYHTKKELEGNEFVRTLTYRTLEQLKAWEQDTIGWCDAINSSEEKGRWGKNSNSCGAYWRSCEYIHLCKARSQSDQQMLMEAMYDKQVWNPYPDSRSFEEVNNG